MPKRLLQRASDFVRFRAYDILWILCPDWRWSNWAFSQFHFMRRHKRLANPNSPRDINDYVFGRKCDARLAQYGMLVDKAQFKRWIASTIGPQVVVPTLGVFSSASALSDFVYPAPYIVKPTHMSGQVLLKAAGGALSSQELQRCQRWLNTSFFKITREQNYRHLEPKIIIEPLMRYQGQIPPDLKFTMKEGRCAFIQLDYGRFSELRRNLYTAHWQKLDIRLTVPNLLQDEPPPAGFSEMLTIAESVASFLDFVRVDFLLTDEGFKLIELTLTPGNAGERFLPTEAGEALWQSMQLPSVSPDYADYFQTPLAKFPAPEALTLADTVLQCS